MKAGDNCPKCQKGILTIENPFPKELYPQCNYLCCSNCHTDITKYLNNLNCMTYKDFKDALKNAPNKNLTQSIRVWYKCDSNEECYLIKATHIVTDEKEVTEGINLGDLILIIAE